MTRRVAAVCILPALVLACGDILVVPGGSTSSNGTLVQFNEDGGVSTLVQTVPLSCPSIDPSVNDSVGVDGGYESEAGTFTTTQCEGAGGACEYGASAELNPDPSCNRIFTCKDDVWAQEPQGAGCFEQYCPKLETLAKAIDGTPCDLGVAAKSSDEAICNVADGTCACTTGAGNGDSHGRIWVCSKPILECPLHRPQLGAVCSNEGVFCDYGSCSAKRAPAVMCANGMWVETSTTCF